MAQSPQTLIEFSENLVSDLKRGAITAQEAISACQQYAYLREALSTKSLDLSQASLTGDDELLQALTGILTETKESLRDLPSFHTQEPDEPREEKEVRDIAFLRDTALHRAKEHTKKTLAPYQERRREFIHELVTRYSSTIPTIDDQRISPVVDRALAQAAGEATTAQTKERFAEMLVSASEQFNETAFSADQRARLINDAREAMGAHENYVSAAVSANKTEQNLAKTLYEHLDVARPDVVADIVLSAPQDKQEEALIRGIKLAEVAETLERRERGTTSSRGFLTHQTASGVTKGIQQATEGILSVVGEPVRDIVYKNKVNGVFRSMLANTQELSDRLGGAFVHSAFFTQISQNLSKSLSEKPQTAQAGSIVGDVFSTVFRGPLDPAITQAAKERMFDYLELSRASANAPKGFGFFPSDMSPWELFGVSRADRRASGGYRPSITSRFPYIPFGIAGSWIANGFSTAVDRTTSFLFSNPSFPMALQRFRRNASIRTPIGQDTPLLLAIVVISVILLLFIFPSFLNLPQLSQNTKTASLLVSLFQKEGNQGSGGGQSVDCSKNPSHPLCTFKSCPTCSWPTSGYVTQGPNVTCNKKSSHASGNDVNAVDIGTTSQNIPVYSVTGGTVVVAYNSCGEGGIGNTCGAPGYGGYGNAVVIRSDNGYLIIYGHLNKAINPQLHAGAPVSKGMQVGWMNQSGSSTGQHLHFGVLSGGNVLDLLPDSPLNKADILGCVGSDLKCSLVGKSCPGTAVSAK